MRIVSIIVGGLFVAAGIYCFVNMQAAFLSLALVIGLVMVVYGISQIVTWFSSRKDGGTSALIAGEGILTTLIGLLIIFYPFTSELVLAIWFAVWLVISGVMRIVGAIQIRKSFAGSPWGFMLFMGIISILVGIYACVHPMIAGMTIAILLGIFFILQGINTIITGVSLPGMKSK